MRTADATERLWRARRRRDRIDALVTSSRRGWELEYRWNGRRLLAWPFASRDDASAAAAARLQELLRAGWISHW
jgi:hypothetical protein